MNSKLFKINLNDAFKGLVMVILGAILGSITQIVNLGRLPEPEEWKAAFMFGAGAGLTYLMKNFFTNSNGEFAEYEKDNQ